MSMREEEPRLGLLRDLIHFVAWAVASLGVMGDMALARGLAQVITVRVGAGMSSDRAQALRAAGSSFGWVATFTDMVISAVMACVGLGLIIYLEYHLRRAAARRQLARRFLYVAAAEVAVGAVLYGVTSLLT